MNSGESKVTGSSFYSSVDTRIKPYCRPMRGLSIASVLLVALALATSTAAQDGVPKDASAAGGAPSLDGEAIRTYIAQRLQPESGKSGPIQRMEIKLGTLDSRVQLAACARMEPYAPGGARPWGRTVIGVRCVAGANWNILIPVTVSIWGTALVATTPMAAGTPVEVTHFRAQVVEWSSESTAPVFNAADLVGRTLTRALQVDQTLRSDMLRPTPVLFSGDTVTVRISGSGFSISAQGQALSTAGEGQNVRVRTAQGRMLSGVARADKRVEVAL